MGVLFERLVRIATCSLVLTVPVAHGRAEPPRDLADSTDASSAESIATGLEAAQRALRDGALVDALALAGAVAALDPTNWRAFALTGAAHQRAGRPADACAAFESALRHAPEGRLQRLTYNLGVVLLSDSRLEAAEDAFVRAAGDAIGTLALLSWIGAAEAALERADGHAALSHLERARAADPEGTATDLLEPLVEEAHAMLATTRERHASAARLAIEREDCALASREYREALSDAAGATVDERVELAYGLGLSLYLCDRPEEAVASLEVAVRLDPEDVGALVLLGRASTAARRYARAQEAYEAALRIGSSGPMASMARRRLVQVRELRRDLEHAAYAAVSLEGGFDSNPRRSGVSGNDTLSVGASDGGSALLAARLRLGLRAPKPARWGGGIAYGLDQLVYLEPSARELSLQLHQFRGEVALQSKRSLAASVGGSFELMALGLSDYDPIAAYGGLYAAIRVAHSDTSSSEIDVRVGSSRGIGAERAHLTGPWWDARFSEQIAGRRISGGVSAKYSEARLGMLRIDSEALPAPACVVACDTGGFVIPFAYRAMQLGADLRWASARRPFELRFGASAQGRFYLEHGYATTPTGQIAQESLARRRDLRVETGVELGIPFAYWGRLGARYTLAGQLSTVDGTSEWDYDDQQFARHGASIFLDLRL